MSVDKLATSVMDCLNSCDTSVSRVASVMTYQQLKVLLYTNFGVGAVLMMGSTPSIGRIIGRMICLARDNIQMSLDERRYRKQLRAEFGELLDEEASVSENADTPERSPISVLVPFNGIEQLAYFDQDRGGFLVHDETDVYLAKKLHVYEDSKARFTWQYIKLDRYDLGNHEVESPVIDSPLPALMPDESDSFCAVSSTPGGKGPFMGAWRDQNWLITARHGMLPGKALHNYASSFYVKIDDIRAFGCSGHDLIALKILNAESVFAQLQIKAQKHFYPLARGAMYLKGHIGPDHRNHVSHGALVEIPEDRFTGTIHHTASSVPGMSGSPIFARFKGRTVLVGMHLGTWSADKGNLNVAANYHAIQRLRKAIGTVSSLSHEKAYSMLSSISRVVHTESPTYWQTQAFIAEDQYQQAETLVAAKSGNAKELNRERRGEIAGENAQRDGEAWRRQAAETYSSNFGQGATTSNRDRRADSSTIGQRSQQQGRVRIRFPRETLFLLIVPCLFVVVGIRLSARSLTGSNET